MTGHPIKDKIKSILCCFSEETFTDRNSSLLVGKSGLLLFLSSLSKNKILEDNLNILDIEHLANDIINDETILQSNTLASGLPGLYYVFSVIHSYGMIDESDVLCFPINQSLKQGLSMLKSGVYDYLHGGIGSAYIALHNSGSLFQNKFLIGEYVKVIDNLLTNNKGLIYDYNLEQGAVDFTRINFGLAHGLPSIIKFCVECYKKGVSRKLSYKNATGLINYMLGQKNADTGHSYFPYGGIPDASYSTQNQISRLAWCYGDLTIGYILYQAGTTFNDQKITSFALEVLEHTTKRRTEEETMVVDAAICHGSAGVAHIYNRIWHYTQKPIFKEATDFWIKKTLDFAVHPDGIAGYKRYNPTTGKYVNEYGLLEGAAGIGLVLLSYLTGDFSWDYCLMLND